MKSVDAFNELKHSIRMHLLIMAGPTQQLCTFLVKLIDFMEDDKKDRKEKEMLGLSYSIIEGLALYVQRSIDERATKAKSAGSMLPIDVAAASDEILVVIGKTRNLDDKRNAKYAVLRTVSEALKSLGNYTKAQYPQLTDADGGII